MTKKEIEEVISEVEVLLECNKVMINRLHNSTDPDVSEIIELLTANISWLEFNSDCLKTGVKKVF